MPEVHAKNLLHEINGVSAAAYTKQVAINIDNDVAETTAAGDLAKTFMEGVYGHTMDADYNWYGGSGQVDDTIFKMLSSGSLPVQVVPGGGTVSNDNPMYRGNYIVRSYSITCPANGVVTARASYQGDGVLNRYTSGSY